MITLFSNVCTRDSGAIVAFYGATPEPLVFRPISDGTIQGPHGCLYARNSL